MVRASHLHCEGPPFESECAHFVRDTEEAAGSIPAPSTKKNLTGQVEDFLFKLGSALTKPSAFISVLIRVNPLLQYEIYR